MIKIPQYKSGGTASISFVMIFIGIAISRGFALDTINLSADPADDVAQLNRIVDWLIEQYPDEFEREA